MIFHALGGIGLGQSFFKECRWTDVVVEDGASLTAAISAVPAAKTQRRWRRGSGRFQAGSSLRLKAPLQGESGAEE